MFKATETMTRDLITVTEETPVYDAMKILVDSSITGLPVVSSDNHLLGMVSEKDMLSLLYGTGNKYSLVSEVMTREIVSFDENDDLIDICECLIKNHFRRVPILSGSKLVGVISRRDIIKFILSLRKQDSTS